MVPRDIHRVLELANECGRPYPSEEAFLRAVHPISVYTYVATCGKTITAYMLYRLCKREIVLVDLVVNPRFGGRG